MAEFALAAITAQTQVSTYEHVLHQFVDYGPLASESSHLPADRRLVARNQAPIGRTVALERMLNILAIRSKAKHATAGYGVRSARERP